MSNFLTGSLKAVSVPPSIIEFEKDIQEDFQRFFELFLSWMPIGYRVENGEEISYVEAEDQARRLAKRYDAETVEKIKVFISTLLKGQKPASSHYGIFCEDYESSDNAKFSNKTCEALAKFKKDKAGLIEFIAGRADLQAVSTNDWWKFVQKLSDEDSNRELWKTISGKLYDQSRKSGAWLRKKLGIVCNRPNDRAYCWILHEMLRGQLSSCSAKYLGYLEEISDLEKEVAELVKPLKNFSVFESLMDELSEAGTGIGKYFVVTGITKFAEGKEPDYKLKKLFAILSSGKFNEIVQAEPSARFSMLQAWRRKSKLRFMKEVKRFPRISLPLATQKINLGLFKIEKIGSRLVFELGNFGKIECLPSRYFENFKFSPFTAKPKKSKGKKKSSGKHAGYEISFNHQGKEFQVKGLLKTVDLLRRGDEFFIMLPYDLGDNEESRSLARFFKASRPDLKQVLPNGFKAAAFDLNIDNPVVGVSADVRRGSSGDFLAMDYGSATVVGDPTILERPTDISEKLKVITRKVYAVLDSLREFKDARSSGREIASEIEIYLRQFKDGRSDSPRYLIQRGISLYKKELRALHAQTRDTGYKNLSEIVRLIETMDAFHRLRRSYDCLHTKVGEKPPAIPYNFASRRELKKLGARRYAAAIARYCLTNRVSLVFLEDLDGTTHKDKYGSDNSITRQFAPRMLLESIERALSKIGVAVCLVNKNGTSKRDPVGGGVACRLRTDRNRLVVRRAGKLGWVHPDKAAALNILFRGLGHSVVPYSFTIGQKAGKCFERFSSEHREVRKLPKGRYYMAADQIWTADEHSQEIKDLRGFEGYLPEFSLSPQEGDGYEAFRDFRCLTMPKSLPTKKLQKAKPKKRSRRAAVAASA